MATGTVIYKCSCGAYHPWSFDGDCRDDDNRYSSPEEYADENNLDADDIEVRAIDAEDGDDDEDGEDDEDDEDEDDDEDDEDDDDGDEDGEDGEEE